MTAPFMTPGEVISAYAEKACLPLESNKGGGGGGGESFGPNLYTRYPNVARALGLSAMLLGLVYARAKVSCIQGPSTPDY